VKRPYERAGRKLSWFVTTAPGHSASFCSSFPPRFFGLMGGLSKILSLSDTQSVAQFVVGLAMGWHFLSSSP
jgi:hypothetical protein